MRILYVNPHYDAASDTPEELLRRHFSSVSWCRAVAGAGAEEVTVLQRSGADAHLMDGPVRYRLVHDGLPAALPKHSVPRLLLRLAAGLPADVVHWNGWVGPARLLRRSLPSRTALVWQHHGGPPPRALFRPLLRPLFGAMDLLLFTAEEQAAEWKRAGVLAPGQATAPVVEATCEFVPQPRAEARRRTGLKGDPALLWVGRLTPNKDPLTVLRGFAAALRELPGAHLTFVYQDGGLIDELRRGAAELGIGESTTFRGAVPREELDVWYSAADSFVLGSHREGSGYALIEAMACGCRPVVTAIPSFRAIAGEALAGSFWPPGDPAAFARALVSACRGADMRPAVLERFRSALSPGAIGQAALRAYRRAAEIRNGPGPQ